MNRKRCRPSNRVGLSLIEVLVVIFIILIVIAIAIPAVLSARDAARKSQCRNNLRHLGLAMTSFAQVNGSFPLGGNAFSSFCRILPYMDQENVYANLNLSVSATGLGISLNRTVYQQRLASFLCPSDDETSSLLGYGPCNYGGNVGVGFDSKGAFMNGPFAATLIDPKIREAQVRDGMSNTVAISEFCRSVSPDARDPKRAVFELEFLEPETFQSFMRRCNAVNPQAHSLYQVLKGECWAFDGLSRTLYNHNNNPNKYSCTHGDFPTGSWAASSMHRGGVNSVFLDGHVRFTRDTVHPRAWRAMGSISGGELIDTQ